MVEFLVLSIVDSFQVSAEARDLTHSDSWFRSMWLSNRDFEQLFQKAIFTDDSTWPPELQVSPYNPSAISNQCFDQGCIVVNGMSRNTGQRWSLKEGRDYLGYEPQDDAFSALASSAVGEP